MATGPEAGEISPGLGVAVAGVELYVGGGAVNPGFGRNKSAVAFEVPFYRNDRPGVRRLIGDPHKLDRFAHFDLGAQSSVRHGRGDWLNTAAFGRGLRQDQLIVPAKSVVRVDVGLYAALHPADKVPKRLGRRRVVGDKPALPNRR